MPPSTQVLLPAINFRFPAQTQLVLTPPAICTQPPPPDATDTHPEAIPKEEAPD